MNNYNNLFNKIHNIKIGQTNPNNFEYKEKKVIKKVVYKDEGLCFNCNLKMFYDNSTDNYICESCGNCEKAHKEFHTYKEINSVRKRRNTHRHKFLRLRRVLNKMNIHKKEERDLIIKKFWVIIEYFQTFNINNRKNILRYDYIVYKLFQIFIKKYKIKYRLNLTKLTIREYDEIWEEFCKLKHYKFIKTPR